MFLLFFVEICVLLFQLPDKMCYCKWEDCGFSLWLTGRFFHLPVNSLFELKSSLNITLSKLTWFSFVFQLSDTRKLSVENWCCIQLNTSSFCVYKGQFEVVYSHNSVFKTEILEQNVIESFLSLFFETFKMEL